MSLYDYYESLLGFLAEREVQRRIDKIGLATAIETARITFMRNGWNNYATGWTTGDVDFY